MNIKVNKVKILDYLMSGYVENSKKLINNKVLHDVLINNDFSDYDDEFKEDYYILKETKFQVDALYKMLEYLELTSNEEIYTIIDTLDKYISELSLDELLYVVFGGTYIQTLYIRNRLKLEDPLFISLKEEGLYDLDLTDEIYIELIESMAKFELKYDGVLREKASINPKRLDKVNLFNSNISSKINYRVTLEEEASEQSVALVYTRFSNLMDRIVTSSGGIIPGTEPRNFFLEKKDDSFLFLKKLGMKYAEDDLFDNFRKSMPEQSREFIYILRGVIALNNKYPNLAKVYSERIKPGYFVLGVDEALTKSLNGNIFGYLANPKNISNRGMDDLTTIYLEIYKLVDIEAFKSLLSFTGENKYNILSRMDPGIRSEVLKSSL